MDFNINCKITCGFFDSDVTFPGLQKTKERIVNHYELEICNNSTGKTFINDTEYVYSENIMICAKPGQRRYSILPYRCVFISVTTEDLVLKKYLDAIPDVINFEENYRYKNLFYELALMSTGAQKQGNELYIYGRAMQIISELVACTRFSENIHIYNPTTDNVITRALDFIEQNFLDNISLEDVAGAVNLSPVYFHNKFLKTVGVTLHKYIIDRRIKEAQKFLLTTNMSFTDISFESGFASQSYFNYVFKREVGCTPTLYRKNMMKKYME